MAQNYILLTLILDLDCLFMLFSSIASKETSNTGMHIMMDIFVMRPTCHHPLGIDYSCIPRIYAFY